MIREIERIGLTLADEDDPVESDGEAETIRVVGPPYASAEYQSGFVEQLEDALIAAGFSGSAWDGFERDDATASVEGIDGDPEDDLAPWIEITQR